MKTRIYFIVLNVEISFKVVNFIKSLYILKKIKKKRLTLVLLLIVSS